MCIGNEHKPTKKEVKELKYGFKVFCRTPDGKLASPFCNTRYLMLDKDEVLMTNQENPCYIDGGRFNYTDAPTDSEGFYTAQELKRQPKDAGFYSFRDLKSAQMLVEALGDGRRRFYPNMIIMIVEHKDIVGVGDVNNMVHNDDEFPKGCVIRCGKIRIISETLEGTKWDSPQ